MIVREDVREKIAGPFGVFKMLKKYQNARKEHFFVLFLDGSHKIISKEVVSVGIATRSLVHPREVFRTAIVKNAIAIIVAHNHPSGNLELSPDDIEVTERLLKAGEIIGINILDHVIISRQGYISFKEMGLAGL
jgi:DNA repair protein RadC